MRRVFTVVRDQVATICTLAPFPLLVPYPQIIRRLFGKWVTPAHISRASSRLSLCSCAVTSSINWEATDVISWNSCYVYVCSCALNMFKTIEGAADCEIRSVIRFFFWTLGMCYQVRFITISVKCMLTMRWVMAWLGNGFGCSMKDDRTCTMRHFLLHDNAWPHSAAQTQDLITSFKWEQMDHPPYSPDLSPSDFHLFLHLKKFLGGMRFDDDDDPKDAVQKWLTSQATAFYEEGVQHFVPR